MSTLPTIDALLVFKTPVDLPQHCHCTEQNRPCDGVLAGGPCDNIQPIAPPEKEGDL